jgi:hypothetical protein
MGQGFAVWELVNIIFREKHVGGGCRVRPSDVVMKKPAVFSSHFHSFLLFCFSYVLLNSRVHLLIHCFLLTSFKKSPMQIVSNVITFALQQTL